MTTVLKPRVAQYVRTGCQDAVIEIELYQKPRQRNVIIRRMFGLNDATTWTIDHKRVTEKQVQELIASLNIQVDNLCQMLPQHRVQDFSKLDQQQLLRSTLSAVGGQESVSQLDQLIAYRTQQRGLSSKQQNNAQVLEEKIRLNDRLKIVIEAMKQRKEIEKQIEICEKKKLWIEYQDLREKVKECTQDKKNAQNIVNTHKAKAEPLEKLIAAARTGIQRLEQQRLGANREINTLKDKAKEIIDAMKNLEYKMKDIDTSLQEKIERHQNRRSELAEARIKLDKLKTDRTALVEKVGDETRIKMEIAELRKPIAKINSQMDALKKQKLVIQCDLDNNVIPQIRMCQNKLRQLEDVGEKRLDTLRTYNEDSYNAVQWLRQNRDMFQHPVYEPMMLEINFTDPKFARYLNSTVPDRDLVAFTFESTQDMNLFLQKVRLEGGLKRVNAICSPGGRGNYQTDNIQQLSYLGFYTYLVDTITAPDAIIRYLCKQYGIHRIPIGNQHTYNNSGKVPPHINYFFTENHRFTIRRSAYSGATSSSTIEIRPPTLLANTVDAEQITNWNNQVEKHRRTEHTHKEKINDIDSKVSNLEAHLNELNTKLKKINEGVEKVRTLGSEIRLQAKKVEDIENEPELDIQKEKVECRKRQRDCIATQCKLQEELCTTVVTLHTTALNGEMWKEKLQFSRNAIVDQETELRELKSELRNAEATLENIDNTLTRAMNSAKEKLTEAKRSCNNKLPQNPDFPYKKEFESLPSTLNGLQEHCYELQTRRDCMENGDEQVIQEYEEREKEIADLKSQVASSSDMNKDLDKKMKQIQSKWLPPLEKLLRDINKGFGHMFEKMGCAGEVKLVKGGSEEDFDKYGISIMVRFRAEEQLQQLTRHTQSGGERSLATAIYLMALQRLTTVPFRCVDEINQGMDRINERKMLQLLVKVTTEIDNSQYFLLTPKLLTNLEYNPKIMVHTVMNGKHIMPYDKWNYDKFISRARHYKA
ncbi:structural maintenance of chromosomes protein 5 isoform X2 [Manduca sexta]|uniref:structural maintenance of chromosomes protein 5 isoform X2 n=1 Tax=Manduca sexta TaxID=7130 RepID=UPI00189018E7|nr:structural maintenance of chromosomes protein 5 isoform X2 [Manduca sexta]